MKYFGGLTVFIFILIVIVPILAFNTREDAISMIDNRELATNPFTIEMLNQGDITANIENYVEDRIGYRDEMILAYTILNDKLFGKMVHPLYVYGKEEYVFGYGLTVENPYTEYHEAFADMIKSIQNYCTERDIPFLFVFNPAKPAVYEEYIADGVNFDRRWVELFFEALDERNVNYIDNTQLMKDKKAEGEIVFNKKYDANHWNDLGAYYGTNAVLTELQNRLLNVHVNKWDELIISERLQTSLPASEFPIDEAVPYINIDMNIDKSNTLILSKELYRHPSYQSFGYYTNEQRIKEGGVKALVFQGSYMNNYGYKYFANGFGEYIHVHDYQNVINFPYYFNIFQPECVIFEVAEYTLTNSYFNYDEMLSIDYNPSLNNLITQMEIRQENVIEKNDISVTSGESLTTIRWNSPIEASYAWLYLDKEYDMQYEEEWFEATVQTNVYNEYIENVKIYTLNDSSSSLTLYKTQPCVILKMHASNMRDYFKNCVNKKWEQIK